VTAGPSPRPGGDGERPPVGGSWTALYAGVIASLVVIVALLRLLSEAFR